MGDGGVGDVVLDVQVTMKNEIQYCANSSEAGTYFPVMSKEGKAAVEEVFVEATQSPSPAPTAAPTPAPTYYPTVSAASLVAKEFVAGAVTLAPTAAPTLPPTAEGKVYETQEIVKPVVVVPISFPLTTEEAADPVMQKSLKNGMAKSLGVDEENVRITKINGQAVAQQRRLTDVEIEFKVIAESTDTTALESTIKEAATEGHIVANVQQEASSNGVLTPSLKYMDRKIAEPTIAKETIKVTVVVVKDAPPTAPPTASPTAPPTTTSTTAEAEGEAAFSGATLNNVGMFAMMVSLTVLLQVSTLEIL